MLRLACCQFSASRRTNLRGTLVSCLRGSTTRLAGERPLDLTSTRIWTSRQFSTGVASEGQALTRRSGAICFKCGGLFPAERLSEHLRQLHDVQPEEPTLPPAESPGLVDAAHTELQRLVELTGSPRFRALFSTDGIPQDTQQGRSDQTSKVTGVQRGKAKASRGTALREPNRLDDQPKGLPVLDEIVERVVAKHHIPGESTEAASIGDDHLQETPKERPDRPSSVIVVQRGKTKTPRGTPLRRSKCSKGQPTDSLVHDGAVESVMAKHRMPCASDDSAIATEHPVRRPAATPWTDEETDRLRQLKASGLTTSAVAKALSRSRHLVRKLVLQHNITGGDRAFRRWKPDEVKELARLLREGLTPVDIAARLNRPVYGVQGAIRTHRLPTRTAPSRWSSDEMEVLARLLRKGLRLVDIAAKLNRSVRGVQERMYKHGLKTEIAVRPWSTDELETLQRLYHARRTPREIALRIQRPIRSVTNALRRSGEYPRSERWTSAAIEALLQSRKQSVTTAEVAQQTGRSPSAIKSMLQRMALGSHTGLRSEEGNT